MKKMNKKCVFCRSYDAMWVSSNDNWETLKIEKEY